MPHSECGAEEWLVRRKGEDWGRKEGSIKAERWYSGYDTITLIQLLTNWGLTESQSSSTRVVTDHVRINQHLTVLMAVIWRLWWVPPPIITQMYFLLNTKSKKLYRWRKRCHDILPLFLIYIIYHTVVFSVCETSFAHHLMISLPFCFVKWKQEWKLVTFCICVVIVLFCLFFSKELAVSISSVSRNRKKVLCDSSNSIFKSFFPV